MYQTNVESLNASELQGEKAEQADEAAGEPNDVTDDNPSWAGAAGGAISTLNDLIIWAKADATGALLSPQAQKERLSWVSPPPSPGAQYGLAIAEFPGLHRTRWPATGLQQFRRLPIAERRNDRGLHERLLGPRWFPTG
jgi:Beta-lactamase